MNADQILMLKPLGAGADPTTFYAPLGCTSNEGRLYRRNVEERGTSEEAHAAWDAQEMWRVEVCFFTAADGLSGWKRFAPSMGRDWFVPVSIEAEAALDMYMRRLEPASTIKSNLDQQTGYLVGTRLRLKQLKMSGGDTTPERRELMKRVGKLEEEIHRLITRLSGVEARRQKAQGMLLVALGWEGLLEALGGDDHG